MANKNLGPKILELRGQGKTYNEIVSLLGCSKGTVGYHLGDNQKQKTRFRTRIRRRVEHPFVRKLEKFKSPYHTPVRKPPIHKTRKLIQLKIETFFKDRRLKMYTTPSFTVQDVLDKAGPNPTCYLTGQPIDINQPRTYNFDHIIPVSKGGQNTLDNLGICTKKANESKTDMTPDEFIAFCKLVVEHNSKH